MNVYVRELVSALAQAGVQADVFTRRADRRRARRGRRRARLPGRPRRRRPGRPGQGAAARRRRRLRRRRRRPPRGRSATSTPSTPTTGSRAWPATASSTSSTCRSCRPSTPSPASRPRPAIPSPSAASRAEAEVIGCSDAILASCAAEADQLERLYGADRRPHRARRRPASTTPSSPPGPATARAPRCHHLDLGDGPVLLFVGRIQPLKGLDVAVRALAALGRPDARLVVVGGASGTEGADEVERIDKLAADLGVTDQLRMVAPVPHHLLSTYYRAADVVLVPSRSESFGLVALEAAACGTPVVAAAVGGLRTLVEHGRTGFLVEGRDPAVFAAYAEQVLDSPALAAELSPQRCRARRATTRGPPRPGACAASTATSPPAPSSTAAEPPRRWRPCAPDGARRARARASTRGSHAQLDGEPGGRRGRSRRDARRAALVRAGARRAEGHLHDLVPPAAAHAALRDLRDAGARGEPRRVLRAPAAPQPASSTAPPSPSARRTPSSSSASSTTRPSPTTSSTASSARSTRGSSSSSAPPSASASPPASRADSIASQCLSVYRPARAVGGVLRLARLGKRADRGEPPPPLAGRRVRFAGMAELQVVGGGRMGEALVGGLLEAGGAQRSTTCRSSSRWPPAGPSSAERFPGVDVADGAGAGGRHRARGEARRRARRLPGRRRRRHPSGSCRSRPASRWPPSRQHLGAGHRRSCGPCPTRRPWSGVGAAAIAARLARRRGRPGLGRVAPRRRGLGGAGAGAAARRRHRPVGIRARLRLPRGRGADRGGRPRRPAARRERGAQRPDAARRGDAAGHGATRAPRRCGPRSPRPAARPPPACACWSSTGPAVRPARRRRRRHRAHPRARRPLGQQPQQPL